ncbi:hypothetical protein KIL84_000424 [Mauremys mutica]|uniref:Uncharacterized protein n=1 Tax=Mauremys mutica TaxID=74926 RepID=A0A9D3XGV0_9SAUR|nr:hypothetical protein KIL84_000424 [Mauremys mutica]
MIFGSKSVSDFRLRKGETKEKQVEKPKEPFGLTHPGKCLVQKIFKTLTFDPAPGREHSSKISEFLCDGKTIAPLVLCSLYLACPSPARIPPGSLLPNFLGEISSKALSMPRPLITSKHLTSRSLLS